MEKVAMNIEGMTCNGCVTSVSRVLSNMAGVQHAEVTLTPGRADVTFDPAKTSRDALKAAIEDAGYDVVD